MSRRVARAFLSFLRDEWMDESDITLRCGEQRIGTCRSVGGHYVLKESEGRSQHPPVMGGMHHCNIVVPEHQERSTSISSLQDMR